MKKDRILCLIETTKIKYLAEEINVDAYQHYAKNNGIKEIKETVIPLYDHIHNDIENGQKEKHYHINTKYMSDNGLTDLTRKYLRVNLPLKDSQKLEYRMLFKISEFERLKTPVSYISKLKIKNKCIHKGKCPHRGFDLSNELSVNGIITCPLHGLQFNSKTKQLI